MCRLYGFRANEATKVECTLVHAQNALMIQAESDEVGKEHGHGWGLATFDRGIPTIQKRAWAAYQGEHFPRAAAGVYSDTVVAHVRRATVGDPAPENTHPFADRKWVLAHNGTISNFQAIREKFLDEISPARRSQIEGTTDSEHFFQLLMSRRDLNPEEEPSETLQASIAMVRGWIGTPTPRGFGLNVVWTDGCALLATRLGRGLSYIERPGIRDCEICGFPHVHHDTGMDYRAAIVASEPLSKSETWREVPEGSMVEIDRDLRIQIQPLA